MCTNFHMFRIGLQMDLVVENAFRWYLSKQYKTDVSEAECELG